MSRFQCRVSLNGSSQQVVDLGRFFPICGSKDWCVRLVDWVFFSTDYVVNQWNNSFIVTYGGTAYTVVVPVGNYSVSSFVSALSAALLTATGAAIVASYNVSSQVLTLTSPGVTTFSLTLLANSARLLGFDVGTSAGLATTQVGIYIPMITNSPYYGVRIKEVDLEGFDVNDFDFVIPNTGGPGNIVTRTCEPMDSVARLHNNVVGQMNVTFMDSNGNPMPLQNQNALLVFEFFKSIA